MPYRRQANTPGLFTDTSDSEIENINKEDKKSEPSITTVISVSSEETEHNTAMSMDVQLDDENEREILNTTFTISDSQSGQLFFSLSVYFVGIIFNWSCSLIICSFIVV